MLNRIRKILEVREDRIIPVSQNDVMEKFQTTVQASMSRFLPFVPSMVIWVACFTVFTCFSMHVIQEYTKKSPITITTFVEPPLRPEPIIVKICNNVFMDPEKVIYYNKTVFDNDSYNFLLNTMKENYYYDDSAFVIPLPTTNYYLLSSRTFYEFKLDLNRFVFSCNNFHVNKNCSNEFTWHLVPTGGCYEGKFSLRGYGSLHFLHMHFYFDPNLRMGKYTDKIGAYISVYHHDDYVPLSESFFLGPRETATVSASLVNKIQRTSFEQSKCVHKSGLRTYSFNGEPFQTFYNAYFCRDLCIAKYMYADCGCTLAGWNVTKSECIENRKNRLCILENLDKFVQLFGDNSQLCLAKCYKKCDQKSLELKVSKTHMDFTPSALLNKFKFLTRIYDTPLLTELVTRLQMKNYSDDSIREVSDNIAQLTVHFKAGEPVKRMETILLMSGSTFVSNIGGLVGMWLGLSAISVIELLEKTLITGIFWRKNGDENK